MADTEELNVWLEVRDNTELAKVKSVREMMPKDLEENLRGHGRPKLTEEHFRTVEDCLRLDFTIKEACDAAWISVSAFYKYYNEDEDFALRMDRARNFPKQMARTAVMKRIWQWDAKTALRYLELRDKWRYNTDTTLTEEWEVAEVSVPKVQFISVPPTEWADQQHNDSQKSTNPSSASDTYASSSEKQTPWENEEGVLERLAS